MTAPMVDYKIHWLKMMSVPESRAVVGRHDGINGRDRFPNPRIPDGSPFGMQETAGDRQGSEMLPIPVAVIDKVAEQRTSGLKCRADSGDTGGKRSRGQGKTQIQ